MTFGVHDINYNNDGDTSICSAPKDRILLNKEIHDVGKDFTIKMNKNDCGRIIIITLCYFYQVK